MKIVSAALRNFKCLRSFEGTFERVNVIAGDNLEGKSSLLQALAFGMTGKLPGNLDEFITEGEKRMDVAIVLQGHDQALYEHATRVGGRSTERLLTIRSGSLPVETISGVAALSRLAEVLNPKTAFYGGISEQDEGTALVIKDEPSERKKRLKTMLGLDNIDAISDRMKGDLGALDVEYKATLKEKELQVGRTFRYLEIPEVPVVDILIQKVDQLKALRAKYDEQVRIRSRYELALVAWQANQDFAAQARVKAKGQQEIADALVEENMTSEEILRFEIQSRDAWTRLSQNKADKNANTERAGKIAKWDKDIQQISPGRRPRSTGRAGTDIEGDLDTAKGELKRIQHQINLVEAGKCGECERPFEDAASRLAQLLMDLPVSTARVKALTQEREDALASVAALQKWERENEKVIRLQGDIEAEKAAMVPLTGDTDSYESDARFAEAQLKQAREKFDRSQDRQRLLESAATLLQEAEKLAATPKPQEVSLPEPFNTESLDAGVAALETARGLVAEAARAKQHNAAVKLEEQEHHEKLADLTRRADTLAARVEVLKGSRKIVEDEFSAYLIDTSDKIVSGLMNDLFQAVHPYRWQFRLAQDNKRADFKYSEDGLKWRSMNVAGGLEKTLVALSTRVVQVILQGGGPMLLDEVDAALSPEHSQALFDKILSLPDIHQLFIVTHKLTLLEYLDNQYGAKIFQMGGYGHGS